MSQAIQILIDELIARGIGKSEIIKFLFTYFNSIDVLDAIKSIL